MKTALVVPTNRPAALAHFLAEWGEAALWDEIIVVEDNPTRTFDLGAIGDDACYGRNHFSWAEIDADLKADSWIISRRDSAIRSYGFLVALRYGADFVFTLDDDCLPLPAAGRNPFVKEHLKNLTATPRWAESVPGRRTRGLPYFNKGETDRVALSVGLWEGNPDFDAVQTLGGDDPKLALPETRVLPLGQYVPVCGMNMAFPASFAPVCYFAPSGDGQPYRRFDDIWFGVIAKKVADHLRLMVTCGRPYVNHAKASDPMTNLVKEAPGIRHHEAFWEVLDALPVDGDTPLACMASVGAGLEREADPYSKHYGAAIRTWCRCVQKV